MEIKNIYHFLCCVVQVTCQGHIIGAIVADDQATAQRAAKLVKVEYRELEPILTIEVSFSTFPKKQYTMKLFCLQCK